MPPFDPMRPVSPNTVREAIESYGEDPTDVRYLLFAQLVANGSTLRDAYQELFPDAGKSTAAVQGSVLASHPKIRKLILLSTREPAELLRSAMPMAVETMVDVMEGAENPDVRRKAAADVMDRGGLPRGRELRIDAHVNLQATMQQFLAAGADLIDVPPLEELEEEDKPLPALPAGPTSLREDREKWCEMADELHLADDE